jgi:hypothetical protein
MQVSRRKFLTSSSVVTAATLFSDPAFAFHAISNPESNMEENKWYLRMRRVIQHNLN